jgi:hypothetical protein
MLPSVLQNSSFRRVAVVRQADYGDWLQQSRSVAEMLRPFPSGSFTIIGQNVDSCSQTSLGDPFDYWTLAEIVSSVRREALLLMPFVWTVIRTVLALAGA